MTEVEVYMLKFLLVANSANSNIREKEQIMYTLKDNGVISEITCGNNFEYILKGFTEPKQWYFCKVHENDQKRID